LRQGFLNSVDISLTSLHNRSVRPRVPFFLSYAHRDSAGVERFRSVLEPFLQASARFEFGEWIDRRILPGEHWRSEIDDALHHSRFGFLLLSPAFLASKFITTEELPRLLAKPLVVPVELQRILFDGSLDLKGLEHRQVFHDTKGRSFDECRAMTARRDFARELFSQIVALLEKHSC
jgi:TIR domain